MSKIFKPHPDFIKVLLGVIGSGLFFLWVSSGPSANPNSPYAGAGSGLGRILFLSGIAGFVALHIARKPDSKNSLIQTLQEILRPAICTEEEPRAAQLSDETADDDERKAESAKQRYKRDIRFKVELEAGKDLYTIEALQQWKKEQRRRISYDETLSGQEREELLEALEEAYLRYLKNIKAKAGVYEDE